MCDDRRDCPKDEDEICTEDCGIAGPLHNKKTFDGKITGRTEPLEYNKKISPVCLAQMPEPPIGTSCYTTGWGDIGEKTSGNDTRDYSNTVLMEADVKIRSTDHCTSAMVNRGTPAYLSPESICILQDDKGTYCAVTPSVYSRTRRGLGFIADTLYAENYDGWFTDRNVRPYDTSRTYGPKDFKIDVPAGPPDPPEPVAVDTNGWITGDQCTSMDYTQSSPVSISTNQLLGLVLTISRLLHAVYL
ncbi:hypothetical protein RvY_01915 [Ramazzottius varieornatus]|uniref:Peptidase S1 domain-containing protein n=1 Tax=Ramazzottius varieornatus TaxID=947166 RepID=A0A1D1UT53_RAMVA|nr:hypothetical protein RvY_01915 [Ramazzottius varieornatus]